MVRPSRTVALAMMVLVAALATAPTALAAPGPLDPRFKWTPVYFHCDSTITNPSVAAGDPVPSWDTSPPSRSVTEGAGCGTLDPYTPTPLEPQANPADGVWSGTFTGNFDSLTIHVHLMASTTQALAVAAVPSLGIRLTVDGERIVDTSATPVEVIGTSTNLGITELYEVSIKNLGIVEPNLDVDGDGVGDNPFGIEEHEVTLSLDGRTPAVNSLGMWAFDTTEVQSGIEFNPVYLIPPVIERNP
jgi:hypothetical protein